ncbi:MAG: Plug and carboxypeptidase regulatory-like domain-containing protein, partial [Acidobacteria bacterium]|nr:Plug and carboxypeptidase regulatory-like domain-containing protein [Acidobacteriota bacterium]
MKKGIAFLLFCSLALFGQVDTGVITGTLTDSSGAVIAGANVTIRNEATGIETKLSSNSLGQYVSPPLHPGPYSIAAEMRGFRRTVTKIELTLSQRAVVDLSMPVGAIEEQVTVKATAPLLESESATVSNLRDQRAVQDLPLNTRNFNQLVGLAAGVVPAQLQAGSPALTAIRGTTANSVNGMGFRANNFLVDGLDNSENHNGQGILIYPSVDAIQEFRVQTSVTSAEFGRGGGGTVNVSYKSGGRDLHGNAFEFLRNSALDAKNFFDQPGKIAPFRLNQFGGTLGGPVVLPFYNRSRERTFFFVSYEGVRRDQALTYLVTVPLPAFKQGNFSAARNRVYDPLTTRANPAGSGQIRDPFPGSIVPQSRLDRVGQNLANLYPDPNLPGLSSNYSSNPAQPSSSNNIDIKVDQNFSSRDQAFFRYSQQNTDQVVPGSLPLPAVGNTSAGTSRFPLHQFVASYTHTVAPNMINEFRAGVTRLRIETQHLNWGKDVAAQVGIPGINVKDDVLTSGLSRVNVAGYEGLGDAGNRTALIVSENYQWNDAFTWIHGGHTFKFGGEVGRRRYNLFQESNLRGIFTVGNIYSTNPAQPAGTGDGLVDLLLGAPQSGVDAYVTGTRGYRRTEYAAFAQDTWKA